ncbi:MAG: OmpA family protein [Chlorobiales bacterium]|nr:OmpA family protein [Chlorobiales bacterium]
MKSVIALILSLFFVQAGFVSIAVGQDQDRKGSKDHPLLTRMPDFHITDYKELDFDSYKFIGQDKKPVSIEGHKYYFQYNLNQGAKEPGELKIRRNIEAALHKIGGKTIFDDNFNKNTTVVLQKGGKETWVEVRTWNNMYRLNIVEKEIMKQEVVANAEAMGNDINATGHVSIYGIYFDTGKSEIKPESDAAISEIAKLLKNDGALKVYVVGHTDNVGSFDSNMKLSKDRADAVVKVLVSKNGIAGARLKAYGVASLSPIETNDTEDGKAKNRRVELVKQ